MKQTRPNRKASFLTDSFARLVFVYAAQNIALSVTGIIDTAAVGRFVGEQGLAAMKLGLPVFSVIGLFGNVMSTGLSVQLPREITAGRPDRAGRSFYRTGAFAVAVSLLFLVAGLLFPGLVAALLNGQAAGETIRQQMTDYLKPILIGALPVLCYYILSAMAAMEGGERYITASSAAILFVDALGDLLAVKTGRGLAGIACASIAAYLAADVVLFAFFLTHNTVLKRKYKATGESGCLGEVLRSGMPMAVKYVCTILCPILINRLMLRYGTVIGLAALSVQDAVHYVPEALCRGISSAVLLLTGIYCAEQDRQKLEREKICVLQYSLLGFAVSVVLGLFARPILGLFTTQPELVRSGVSALRWYLVGVPFTCINFAVMAYLQSMKKSKAANTYIVLNRLLLPVSITWGMGALWGMEGIYASFAVSEIVAVLIFAAEQLVRALSGKAVTIGSEAWTPLIGQICRDVTTVREAVEVSEEIFTLCRTHRIDRKRAGQISLCMEELAVNSIRHGFSDGKKHHAEIRFMLMKDRLILRIRDNGRYYDLTEQSRMLHPENPAEHIGLRLVFGCADEVRYSHAFRLNHVSVSVSMPAEE